MKAFIALSALALAASPAAPQPSFDTFCGDLESLIAAAREAPPFGSLSEGTRLGPSDQCGALLDEHPRFFCVMESRIGAPVDSEGLRARVRQCLGERLSVTHVGERSEERFAVAGSGGATLLVHVTGCANCRGGARLSLFVYPPERRR